MFEWLNIFSAFHFLRPYWLLAILPMIWIWKTVRFQPENGSSETGILSPHLLKALTPEAVSQKKISSVDSVLVAFVFMVISTAGPTWNMRPNPFAPPTPPAVVLVKVSQSMLAKDIQPSRLERAKHKIRDFATLRAGAQTALIAFAGSAHIVLPLTDDPELFIPFLEGIDPDVMPEPGQNMGTGLDLADSLLLKEQDFGAIVVFADQINPSDQQVIQSILKRKDRVLAALPLNASETASFNDIATVSLTPDNRDVKKLESRISYMYQSSLKGDDSQSWDDKGWFFLWPALMITLLWFRKGWTVRWAAKASVLLMIYCLPATANAQTWVDLFATQDQQGRYAFEQKNFEKAAMTFTDPAWKGIALYRLGKYKEAGQSFSELKTARAYFNQGNALVKAGDYALAIKAYKSALKKEPSNASTQRNLQIATAILARVVSDREQSSLGDQDEITADDIKFDKEAGQGAEVKMTGKDKMKLESAEKWMRTVETQAKDFLKIKFAQDFARRKE